jgi:hypothetical protein
MPPKLKDFEGLWFMDANLWADKCLTLAGTKWDEAKKAFILRIYDEDHWS